MKCKSCGKDFDDYKFSFTGLCPLCNLDKAWEALDESAVPKIQFGKRYLSISERIAVLAMDRDYSALLAESRSSGDSEAVHRICDKANVPRKDSDDNLIPTVDRIKMMGEMLSSLSEMQEELHNILEVLDIADIPRFMYLELGRSMPLPLSVRIQMLATKAGEYLRAYIDEIEKRARLS